MRTQPAGSGVRLSLFHGLDDMQVIEDVGEAAVVRELIEEGPHCFLGVLHEASIAGRWSPPPLPPTRALEDPEKG